MKPEPVSKGLPALMTLGAMAYLSWDTVWRLIDGWLVLMKEVDKATTFDGIYASGVTPSTLTRIPGNR